MPFTKMSQQLKMLKGLDQETLISIKEEDLMNDNLYISWFGGFTVLLCDWTELLWSD